MILQWSSNKGDHDALIYHQDLDKAMTIKQMWPFFVSLPFQYEMCDNQWIWSLSTADDVLCNKNTPLKPIVI